MTNTVTITIEEYDQLREIQKECYRLRLEKEPKIEIILKERPPYYMQALDNDYTINHVSHVLPENLGEVLKSFMSDIDHFLFPLKEKVKEMHKKNKELNNSVEFLKTQNKAIQGYLDKIPNWIKRIFL